MITLENIKRVLTEEGISYTQVEQPEKVGFGFGKGIWLQIEGGCREAPMYIEFSVMNKVFDLHFGRYSYELFEYSEEHVLSALMENIHAIMDGKTHIIWAFNTKRDSWCWDACYYIAPGEADDDTEEYRKALRRIEKPRGWFGQRLGAETTYAIYNWYSYREITR